MNAHSFSRTEFPPGGWQFHDPRTNFTAPMPKADTFDRTVQRIIENRLKNPAMVVRHKLPTDPFGVGKELEIFTRRRLGIPDPVPPPAVNLIMPGLSAAVVGNLSGIKKLAAGSALVLAFEKSGQAPVSKESSEARAAICAICPLNNKGKYEDWKTLPVAIGLLNRTPRTMSLKLSSNHDAKLGLCDGLLCPTRFLIHIPADLLRSKVNRAELDKGCWMIAP